MKRRAAHVARAPEGLVRALEEARAAQVAADRRDRDPVRFVHLQRRAEDREIVALLASSLAFGNVRTILTKVAEALDRLGPSPARAAGDLPRLLTKLEGFRHRIYAGADVARLLHGARVVQRANGSLGVAFSRALSGVSGGAPPSREHMQEALARFCDEIRVAGGLGKSHLLPDPRAGSTVKRLLLFVRWMARPADGIDLGLWDVPTSALVIPVDTHVHKLAKNLGLTRRGDASYATALEITASLATLDPADPVRFDFPLCHLGMLQRCPSRRDPLRCEGCGVLPLCRHWRGREAGARNNRVTSARGP
ncbi:MAG: TIGR02757 family protein [Polyangiaceae bacterium]